MLTYNQRSAYANGEALGRVRPAAAVARRWRTRYNIATMFTCNQRSTYANGEALGQVRPAAAVGRRWRTR